MDVMEDCAAAVSYMQEENNYVPELIQQSSAIKRKVRPSSAVINIKSKMPRNNKFDGLSTSKNSLSLMKSTKNLELINQLKRQQNDWDFSQTEINGISTDLDNIIGAYNPGKDLAFQQRILSYANDKFHDIDEKKFDRKKLRNMRKL